MNMQFTLLIGILAVSISAVACQERLQFLKTQKRLYENLTVMPPDLRPVVKNQDSVNVSFSIAIPYLLELDERTGFLTFEAWLHEYWEAPNLMWNPDNYDGIKNMKLPTDKIWHPDISLYNGGLDAMKVGDVLAIANSDGHVSWIPQATIQATCDSSMRNFPFDTHVCLAIFGSWSHHGLELRLDLSSERVDFHNFLTNTEWEIQNDTIKRVVQVYDCCPEPYYSIEVRLFLKRKSSFLNYVYLSPMVLIALMSPFMFLLPYQQSQRFSLGGSLLICLIMLLVGLDLFFPKMTTGVPLITMYYMSIIVLLLGSMIMSAIILNLAEKRSDPPQIMKKLFGDVLGCFLCIKKESYSNLVEGADEDDVTVKKPADITWNYIAMTLDRFFFVVYIILTIILSIAFTAPR